MNFTWNVKFFYGSTKKINQVLFTYKKYTKILKILKNQAIDIESDLTEIASYANTISSNKLQKRWTHKNQELIHPFLVLDKISELGITLNKSLTLLKISDLKFTSIVGDNLNSKLFENKSLIISGILTGYIFNKKIKK